MIESEDPQMEQPGKARKVFATIVEVTLILMVVLSILWFPVQKVLLNPAVYQQAISDQGFYQAFPSLVSGFLSGEASQKVLGDSLSQITSRVDAARVNQFILGIIPPEWFRQQVDAGISNLFSFITGSSDQFSLSLDFSAVKAGMTSDENLRGMIAILPPCSINDLAGLLSLLGGDGNLPLCRFPDDVMNTVFSLIKPLLAGMVSQLPDEIPLIAKTISIETLPSALRFPLALARNAGNITTGLLILDLALLAALILLSSPGARAKLRNPGIALIIAGAAGLILDLTLWIASNSVAAAKLAAGLSRLPTEFSQVIVGIYLQVVNNALMVEALASFVVLAIGVILFVISRFIVRE